MKKNLIFGVLFLAIFAVASSASFFIFKKNTVAADSQEVISHVNLYSDHADPNAIDIKVGEYVQFDSKDGKNHVVAQGKGNDYGNDHEHSADGLESPEFGPDEGYKVNFKKTGTYFFHDHENPNDFITVIVYDPANPAKLN